MSVTQVYVLKSNTTPACSNSQLSQPAPARVRQRRVLIVVAREHGVLEVISRNLHVSVVLVQLENLVSKTVRLEIATGLREHLCVACLVVREDKIVLHDVVLGTIAVERRCSGALRRRELCREEGRGEEKQTRLKACKMSQTFRLRAHLETGPARLSQARAIMKPIASGQHTSTQLV